MQKLSLTDEQLRIIRSGWIEGLTTVELCLAVGITIDTFKARRRDQLKELPARPRTAGSESRGIDPTPEEIAERAAAIRAGWDSSTWAKR